MLEALACQDLFIAAEAREVRLVWSFMHQDETNLCPFPNRKYVILEMRNLCQVRLEPEEEIALLAKSFQAARQFFIKRCYPSCLCCCC
ncbi:MAG: hypothetical protein SXA11_09880 [Cyanobacteriota bacterium]|nr:hypothetical protein [Cyanobacteriota bacterium]